MFRFGVLGRPTELNPHQVVGIRAKASGGIPVASKLPIQPAEADHLFRYRTSALVGPWRKTARQAVLDAVRARQARRDDRARAVHWLVPGRIEETGAN